MTTQNPILHVQPNKILQLLQFLFVVVLFFIPCNILILSAPIDKFKALDISSLDEISVLFFILMLLMFSMTNILLYTNFLTPSGHLLLTPHGLIVHAWRKNYHQIYHWHEISSFYIAIPSDPEVTQKCSAFDVLNAQMGKPKQEVLYGWYYKPQQMVNELNQWRDQYAQLELDTHVCPLEPITLSKREIWNRSTIFAFGIWLALLLFIVGSVSHKIYLSLSY
jgi:hypothetical protein